MRRFAFDALRLGALGLVTLAAVAAGPATARDAAPAPAPPAAPPGVFDRSFAKLNRVYRDVTGEFAPIEVGPATITLRSPHQLLSVRGNRVRLAPTGAAPGEFAATANVDFLGEGQVIADVRIGQVPQQMQDELLLPPQAVSVDAKVRLERVDGGYRVTPTALPKTVRIAIASKITSQILGLCSSAAVFTLGALDCDNLEATLTHPEIPLPPPGTPYLLSNDDLTPEDRAALDALLSASVAR